MANLAKIVYRPVGMAGGVLAGVVASAIFKRVWKVITHDDDTPDALRSDNSFARMLLAATLQGAIFAAVKAVIDRAGAKGFERATGEWPGN